MSILRRKAQTFELQVQDVTLRITANPELYEEARAAVLQFSDRLNAYAARNPRFRTSKLPVELPDDAPDLMREIAEQCALAGLGPQFAFGGALTDHLGRFLSQRERDVVVASGGGYYAATRKRTKLTVFQGEDFGEGLAIAVDPAHGPVGIYTTMGRRDLPVDSVDGLVVQASSCTLADAAGTYALGVFAKPDSMKAGLEYLQGVPGVLGAMVIRDGSIGVAGGLEIAA